MLKIKHNILAALAAMSVLISFVLCGCGVADSGRSAQTAAPASMPEIRDESVSASGPAVVPQETGESFGNTDEETDAPSGNTDEASEEDDFGSIGAIRAIADMKADVEEIGNDNYCTVFTADEHNPYDVVWDYGKDYRKFIEAVDDAGMWDVLFDIDFYTEHYPMLALLYHDDEYLLLEHFQTVGIHEGRQGSDAFNVAAYMENCDSELMDTFGEHYECYYFYWALNQDSESKIDTQSDGHPIQMTIKMTTHQSCELKKVNEYREEAGVDPVAVDPEFLAFANYRAWCDFTGDYQAHEWFDANHDYLSNVLESFGAYKLGENTVYGETTATGPGRHQYYSNYRNSQKHYETMVSGSYHWFACSNVYWGPDGRNDSEYGYKYCEYDMYLDAMDS